MKVGDYVRTEDGIKKVLKYTYKERYENGHCVWFDNKDCGILFTDEKVNKMKPSSNIIDLIEVGDYVNGCKIIELATNIDGKVLYLETDITEFDNVYACGHINIYEEDIRSIVTKEQFESMEYKVKE